MTRSATRIPSLDGLRAISIGLVLTGHALTTVPSAWRPPGWISGIIGNAQLGVMLFFVLSGYLITRLLLAENEATGRIHLPQFYIRRALRIFPVFYAYLAVIGGLTLAGVLHIAGIQFVSAGLFLWNYKHIFNHVSDVGDWYLGHFWSLAVEEQFYLLWPLAFARLGAVRSRHWCLRLLLLFPLLRVATYFLWPSARPQLNMMFHTAGDALVCGCWLALSEADPPSVPRLWREAGRGTAAAAALFLLFSPWLRGALGSSYWGTVGPVFEGLAATLVLRWSVQFPESLAGRFLNAGPVAWVGRLSYGLYVWQQPFLTRLNQTLLGVFPINLLGAFGAAILSFYLLERPFLRLRKRFRNQALETPEPGR